MPSKVKKLFRDDVTSMPSMPSETPVWRKPYSLALGVLILGLVILFFTNKGLFVAAVVNGKPIFRWDLNKVLVSRFGKQSLEGMISESLITDAAQKAGVTVSASDLNGKIEEIVKSLGPNVKLEDLLTYQGMSKTDFENQVRMQLTVQKVLGKDISITDDDINNYIATNGALLTATDPGALRVEAQKAIMDAKVGEKLQTWFAELKEKAKILRFL